MHTQKHTQTPGPYDSAALFNVQALFNDGSCDPMGTCPTDDGETGLLPMELESKGFGEGASATTPPEPGPGEVEPDICDPMGTCPTDDGETGLVGDLHVHAVQ